MMLPFSFPRQPLTPTSLMPRIRSTLSCGPWTLDWRRKDPTSTPPGAGVMVYDSARQNVVLFEAGETGSGTVRTGPASSLPIPRLPDLAMRWHTTRLGRKWFSLAARQVVFSI